VKARVALAVVGTLVIGYGLFGILATPGNHPVGHALFLVAVLAAHDLVLMPLVLLAGATIGWLVPVPARPAVRIASAVALAVALVLLPFVLWPAGGPG
jgi:hypothetical protein